MVRVLVDGVIYGLQEFGGISRYFTETLSRVGLHRDGIELILDLPSYCWAGTPRAGWIRRIKSANLRPHRVFVRMSRLRTRAFRPEVFHSTYYTPPYWGGMKTVVTVYDFIHEKFPTLLGDARGFVMQKRSVIESADAIIAISQETRNDILRYTSAEESRVTVIYPGVSDAFRAGFSLDTETRVSCATCSLGEPYWLFVGKRGAYKNFGTLLRAFVRLAQQTGGYLVAAGGEPRLEAWQVDLLIRNRLEHAVRLVRLTDHELRAAYGGAAALVCTSLAEGFGIPLIEAMACGTPVVASDIPVFREVAGDAAVYVDPYDEGAVADAMVRVLNEKTRKTLAAQGFVRARQFSWDVSARQLGDVYQSLA